MLPLCSTHREKPAEQSRLLPAPSCVLACLGQQGQQHSWFVFKKRVRERLCCIASESAWRQVAAVVTQPARLRSRAGRGGGGRKSVQPSPVAALAFARGIAPERVWAPETARDVRYFPLSSTVPGHVLHTHNKYIHFVLPTSQRE